MEFKRLLESLYIKIVEDLMRIHQKSFSIFQNINTAVRQVHLKWNLDDKNHQ
jgi:hypothetical protein